MRPEFDSQRPDKKILRPLLVSGLNILTTENQREDVKHLTALALRSRIIIQTHPYSSAIRKERGPGFGESLTSEARESVMEEYSAPQQSEKAVLKMAFFTRTFPENTKSHSKSADHTVTR